jgi:hypothetical protein
MNQTTFDLLKNTTRGKIKNIERIPPCSKESLLDAIDNVTEINDIIIINHAIKKIIAHEHAMASESYDEARG